MTEEKRTYRGEGDTPKVSIVVPVYNPGQYFKRCLESLQGQSYQNTEILLIDDGSTDESPALCDEFVAKDPRFICFHNENAGPSASRNFGIEHATGKYLVFCDSDDVMARAAIKGMVTRAEIVDADLVICGYQRFDNEGNQAEPRLLGNMSGSLITSQKQLARLYLDTKTNMFGISIWAKMYRLDMLNQYGVRFDLTVDYEEDCLFNLAYFRHVERGIAIPEVYYWYRQQTQSLSKGYREGTWPCLVNGYNARKDYVSQFDLPNAEKMLAYPFLVAFETTAEKIYRSDLPRTRKNELYAELITTPEAVEMAKLGLTSKLRRRTELLAALSAGDASALERVFADQDKRESLKKSPVGDLLMSIDQKLKRSK